MYLVDAPAQKIEKNPYNEAEKGLDNYVTSWSGESVIF